jgi:cytidyltransferase-like protein
MRVYVPGTFDCLHVGHINLLDFAATLGEVWVGLNTDEFCSEYKRRPVYSLEDRMRIVESLRQVDEVIVNEGGYDSKPAILECRPTYIVHGDDWVGEAYRKQLGVTAEWLMHRGITLVHPPYTQGVSTTQIRGLMVTGRFIHGDAE